MPDQHMHQASSIVKYESVEKGSHSPPSTAGFTSQRVAPQGVRSVSRGWLSRSLLWGISFIVLTSALGVVGAGGLLSPLSSASMGAHVPQGPTQGQRLLQDAAQSLSAGDGPAHGIPSRCSAVTGAGEVTCSSLTPVPPTLAWSPIGSPQGRSGVSMVYDAADGYVVLFSGGSSSAVQGDTWIFQNGKWTELSPLVSPSPRLGAYMTYYSTGGYVLLFGGWGGNSGPYEYGDTWAFSGGNWQLLIPQNSCQGSGGALSCPSPRDSGSLADNPSLGVAILFGGYGGYGDTWEFSNGKWIQLISSAACTQGGGNTTCPSARSDGAMAWDPVLSGDVLFGGDNGTALNDTWLFHAGKWTELIAPTACTAVTGTEPCPAPREESSLAYDSTDGYMVLFGGYDGSSVDFGDTWTLVNSTWHYLSAASGCANCPGTRSLAGLADDPALGGLLMFGGYAYRGDSWIFAQGNWTPEAPSNAPTARWGASMAWDPAENMVLLFGGTDGSAFNDTWGFAAGTWTLLDSSVVCRTSACPSPRSGAAMGWDATTGQMVLFGGQSSTGTVLRDTWAFAAGAWTEVLASGSCTSTTCPSARTNASLAWDATDLELVLFGGHATSYYNDTWTFSGSNWHEVLSSTQCASQPCPSARAGASFAAAPLGQGGLVLFGGATAATTFVNDTWGFAGGAWTDLESSTQCLTVACPSPRAGAAMAFYPTDNVDILFGGATNSSAFSDTWSFAGNTWTSLSLYGPSSRSSSGFGYDAQGGYLVLVGGQQYGQALGDVWAIGLPFAVATPTASSLPVDLGQSLTFSDTSSGGGASTAINWEGLPPGCATSSPTASITCTPSMNGTYYVTTVAVPGNGLPGVTSNFLSFTVNTDPSVTIRANSTQAALGTNLTLQAVAQGGTASFGQYLWTGLPPGCAPSVSSGATQVCALTSATDLGSWQIVVNVVDSSGYNTTSSPFPLTVSVAPWSLTLVATPSVIDLTQYLTMNAQANGFTGALTYKWTGLPPGCTPASNTSANILCPPTATGTFEISVSAYNVTAGTQTSLPSTVIINPALGAPTLAASSNYLAQGQTLQLQTKISGGTSPYTFKWTGLPPGCLAGDASGMSCVPSQTGQFNISVAAIDATGQQSTTASVHVEVNATLQSVVLIASSDAVDVGGSLYLNATVQGNAANAQLTWQGLPPGCTAGGTNLSCSPTQPGTDSILLTASLPGQAPLHSNLVVVHVYPVLSQPQLVLSATSVAAGEKVLLSVNVTGGDAPYSYRWSGLPMGCLSANLPEISCTPATNGTFDVWVTVTDALGSSTFASDSLTVTHAAAAASSSGQSIPDGWLFLTLLLVVVLLMVILLLLMWRKDREGHHVGTPPSEGYGVAPTPSPPENRIPTGEGAPPSPNDSGPAPSSSGGEAPAASAQPAGTAPANWRGYRPVPRNTGPRPEFGGYDPAQGKSTAANRSDPSPATSEGSAEHSTTEQDG